MPISSINNIPQSVVSAAVSHNFAAEEEARRGAMALNRDFYYGKQEQTLSLVNSDQQPFVMNLMKAIIKKKATLLYNKELVREFDGPARSVSFLEEVYKENKIDSFLQQVDLNAELTGSSVVVPVTDERYDTGVRLRMYDSSAFSPLSNEDDEQLLEALSIVRLVDRVIPNRDTEVQRVLKQQIWTPSSITIYEGEVPRGSMPNELGFIPFANFKGEEVYDQYLGHAPATDLRLLNEELNMLLTDLAFGIRFQAFPPIAVSGWSGDTIVQIHPGRALNLPSGATAGVLQLSPKITEVHAFVQWVEEKTFETNSVPKISVVGGGQAKSGRELLVKWYPLVQVFHEKSLRYQQYELELANTILAANDMELLNDMKVGYNTQGILPIQEEEDNLETDIKLNIRTAIDELMRRNPQIDEIEAESIVRANADFNKEIGIAKDNNQSIMNDEGQEPEGEENNGDRE